VEELLTQALVVMSDRIYLDYQATTPVDPRVVAVMRPYLDEIFGNPHSEHSFGWDAASAVDQATEKVANLIGAEPGEIVWAAGATEANNLAIQGIARSRQRRGNHVVVSGVEHKSVLNTALSLRRLGFVVDLAPVLSSGLVDLDQLASLIRNDTALVSVMLANNEIGTVQPIAEIGAICRQREIVFHTDAAQAAGKLPIDVNLLGVDLLSVSGHKLYGPKGIGALYVSASCPTPLEPLIIGGAQQQGRRAGTVPPFLCVGLGEACRLAAAEMEVDHSHCEQLRTAFWSALSTLVTDIQINGNSECRLVGNLNVRFEGIDANSILTALKGMVAASTGSACDSGLIEPSHVLLAIGLSLREANSSVRFSFGRFTTVEEVTRVAELIAEKIEHFRFASVAE
jgi:cysteine desulfurase